MPDISTPPVIENMQNKNITMIVGVALLIIVMGGLIGSTLFFKQKPKTNSTPSASVAAPLPTEVKVNLTKDGFEPKTVTIKAGGAVRWANTTGQEATVNSDDHPTHQKFKELNLGAFPQDPTQTLVHIFNKPGTFTYHDHFHPDRKGTIVVE